MLLWFHILIFSVAQLNIGFVLLAPLFGLSVSFSSIAGARSRFCVWHCTFFSFSFVTSTNLLGFYGTLSAYRNIGNAQRIGISVIAGVIAFHVVSALMCVSESVRSVRG